ncbi:rifin [Plasmodium falciparum RAJ116]|uniref:Rifin n=1 Tax=Plasmodium falciparum RAJ116 TaxID=580058 RepID=A0A0L0CUM0_PLAFA|nr:rifin [Plasmodium falciparum RAJ116]
MKLHCSKILLFFFPLNILVTSYHVYSKNKPSITSHHTQTNRSLCECDTQSSNYDKDTGMKSVMQQFVDRTSQRFEEYEERMITQRQKYKEQRDKNVQEIIEKDRMDKLLAEKVEKGCLICGCGLGGVAASVGIFGTVAVKELKKAAITTATELAKEAVKDGAMAATIKAAGAEAFKSAVIEGIEKEFGVSILGVHRFESLFKSNTYNDVRTFAGAISIEYQTDSCLFGGSGPATDNSICTWVMTKQGAARVIQGNQFSTQESIKVAVKPIVSDAQTPAAAAVKKATDEAIQRSIGVVDAKYAICQTAIIASVVAIIIIALVMIIIYLILRYRRKKKMKKKAEYTKLLKE